MRIKEEITLVVEKSWVKEIEEIRVGEKITISLKYKPKNGDLVFVTNNDINFITYYSSKLEGNIYPILSIKIK